MARGLGHDEDAKEFRALSRKTAKAYRDVFTDGNGKLKEEFQTGYVLPLYFGMLEGEEKQNAAKLGRGLVFNKYVGSKGKAGSNDANAEYIAKLRAVFEKHNVAFQTAEMGKVDIGGGGTIAYILSLYGMEVIDSGISVLSMHAPWEAISKADLYEAYKGYKAFLTEC